MKMTARLLGLLIFLLMPQIAQACSCSFILNLLGKSEKQFVTEAKNEADAVFLGKVVKVIERSDGVIEAKFIVNKSWKGLTNSTVSVFTNNPKICCNCGFLFRVGEKYMVYASGTAELSTSQCTRTKPSKFAKSDKKYLGKTIPIKKQK